jgi:trehalose 6-phosphate synthase
VATRRKLIVVSNRPPVAFGRDDEGNMIVRRGGGGLVTALRSLVALHDVTWIASAMREEDRLVAEEADGQAIPETARDGSPYRLRLVAHDNAAYDWFYNVVSNPTLWFLQHYLWDLAHSPSFDRGLHLAWDEGYVAVNANFAEAVVDELDAQPDAAVCFHDYHLYLAPRFVRARRPEAALSHFVHIPWPEPDYWRVLPEAIRVALHDGLLANDVVGFHTDRWKRNFLRSCADIVEADCNFADGTIEYDGRRMFATSHPLSVDPSEFDELASSPEVLELEAQLEARRPEQLVVRVDRTDPSKNVVRGFRALERLLEDNPQLHGKVGMLALLDPTRQDIPEYAEYLGAIQRTARSVNDHFQTESWTPIELKIEDNFLESVAAYKQYDVLLVNAIFDGLNLVAKEAPLVNERDGVLVLSENAGVHEELAEWALTVNPFDVAGQAEVMRAALELPKHERHERLEGLRAHIREHDLAEWVEAQLDDLERVPSSHAAAGS